MRRRAALILALSLAALLGAVGAPASAQEPPPEESTTTTETPTTTPSTAPNPTVIPPSTTSTTAATPPGTPPSTIVPPPADDPNASTDAASEPVPVVATAVPPRTGAYSGQESLELAKAVRGELRVARAQAVQSEAAHDLALARVHELEARLTSLQDKVSSLHSEQRVAIRNLEDAQRALEIRAANAYIRGNTTGVNMVLNSADVNDYSKSVVLMQSVLDADDDAITRFVDAKAKVGRDVAETAEAVLRTQRELVTARTEEEEASRAVESAQFDLAVFSAGGQIAIHGFMFPVDDPHNFGPSFGAPRMLGTADAHWHEGVDILAPLGTRLFATERGVLTRVGTNAPRRRVSVWLKGESGTYYYYAHLSAYAPGIAEGQVVEAGVAARVRRRHRQRQGRPAAPALRDPPRRRPRRRPVPAAEGGRRAAPQAAGGQPDAHSHRPTGVDDAVGWTSTPPSKRPAAPTTCSPGSRT